MHSELLSPILCPSVTDLMEDPEVDMTWDGISTLYPADTLQQSSTLPCKRHNDGMFPCTTPCQFPHICGNCRKPDHTARDCRKKQNQHPTAGAGKGPIDDSVSFSPWARNSETAAPLPSSPDPDTLPPSLVKAVHMHAGLFEIKTPINVDTFEALLKSHPNRAFVGSVVHGLRYGFWPYAVIDKDFVPSNESRKQKRQFGAKLSFQREQLKEELQSHRYSHSLGTKLHRGMACMPLHVARNTETGKLRLVHDHSAGEHSLNSLIPKDVRSGSGDSAQTLLKIITTRGVQFDEVVLFKSDVKGAFRILPMSFYWQALQAVRIEDQYYIDRCNTFGNAASQQLFSAFFSLVLWIAEKVLGLTDILSYVDDNFSWEYANKKKYYKPYEKYLPHKQTRLLELWDILGIPHKESKQESGTKLTIVGREIDLQTKRMSMPQDRMDKLLSRVTKFANRPGDTLSLSYCQKLTGEINWIFEVNPLLKAGAKSLHAIMAGGSKDNQKTKVNLNQSVRDDLKWLVSQIQKSQGLSFASLRAPTGGKPQRSIYVHASPVGFAFLFPCIDEAYYYYYDQEAPHNTLTNLHLLAVVCALWTCRKILGVRKKSFKAKHLPRPVIVTADKGCIKALQKYETPDRAHHLLLCAMELLIESDMSFEIEEAKSDSDGFQFVERLSTEPVESPKIRISRFLFNSELKKRTRWIESGKHARESKQSQYPRAAKLGSLSKSVLKEAMRFAEGGDDLCQRHEDKGEDMQQTADAESKAKRIWAMLTGMLKSLFCFRR